MSQCRSKTDNTIVPAGEYWDGSANLPCKPGTFAPVPRPRSQQDSRYCFSCNNLVAANGLKQDGTFELLLSVSSAAGATSCVCPANTFFASSGATAVACVACPTGSTSGADGATSAEACRTNCRVGFWGDPSSGAYSYQCRECPAVIGGNGAKSSTSGVNPGGVTNDICSVCVKGATKVGEQRPAACNSCTAGEWDADGSGSCNSCALGYSGNPGSCTPCPSSLYAVFTTPGSCGASQSHAQLACMRVCAAVFVCLGKAGRCPCPSV